MSKNKRINKVVLAALMATVTAGSLVYASCANGKDGSNDNTIVQTNTITKKLSFTKEDSFFNEVYYLKKAYQDGAFYGIYVNADAKEGTLLNEVEKTEDMYYRHYRDSDPYPKASAQEWQKALEDIYPSLKKYSNKHNVNRISVELETGIVAGCGIRYMNLDNLEGDKMESKENKALLSLKDRGYNAIIEASDNEVFLIKDTLLGNSKFKHFDKRSTSSLSATTIQDATALLDDNFISTWYSEREDVGSESPVVWAEYMKDEDSKEFILEELMFTDNGVHYSKNKKDLEEAQIIELLEKDVVLNDDLKNSNTKIYAENYDPNNNHRFKLFTYIQQTQK